MSEFGDKNYQNQAIRLTDLAVTSPVLQGYRFSNCSIYGPAIMVPQQDVSIVDCSWNSPEGFGPLFWIIEPSRTMVIGAIALIDTQFIGCKFDGIGIAGTEQDKKRMAMGFGESSAG